MIVYDLIIFHAHDNTKILPLVKKYHALFEATQRVLITSSTDIPENIIVAISQLIPDVDASSILVSNKYLDWSGYLFGLNQVQSDKTYLFLNETILTNRLHSNTTVKHITSVLKAPSIGVVGEVDRSAESILIDGVSSFFWVSSYIFSLHNIKIDVRSLIKSLSPEVTKILADPSHYFVRYLKIHRHRYFYDEVLLRSKISSMLLERRFTNYLIQAGITVTDLNHKNKVRKFEKFFESKL